MTRYVAQARPGDALRGRRHTPPCTVVAGHRTAGARPRVPAPRNRSAPWRRSMFPRAAVEGGRGEGERRGKRKQRREVEEGHRQAARTQYPAQSHACEGTLLGRKPLLISLLGVRSSEYPLCCPSKPPRPGHGQTWELQTVVGARPDQTTRASHPAGGGEGKTGVISSKQGSQLKRKRHEQRTLSARHTCSRPLGDHEGTWRCTSNGGSLVLDRANRSGCTLEHTPGPELKSGCASMIARSHA